MIYHTPITREELEAMKQRCEAVRRLPMSSIDLVLGSRCEHFVAMAPEDSEAVGESLRDHHRCLAEIERLQGELVQARGGSEAEAPIPEYGWVKKGFGGGGHPPSR